MVISEESQASRHKQQQIHTHLQSWQNKVQLALKHNDERLTEECLRMVEYYAPILRQTTAQMNESVLHEERLHDTITHIAAICDQCEQFQGILSRFEERETEQSGVSGEQVRDDWKKLVRLVQEIPLNDQGIAYPPNTQDIKQELQHIADLYEELETLIHAAKEVCNSSRRLVTQYSPQHHFEADVEQG